MFKGCLFIYNSFTLNCLGVEPQSRRTPELVSLEGYALSCCASDEEGGAGGSSSRASDSERRNWLSSASK